MKNKILVTGSAGFVGFHLAQKLCNLGYSIIGIDNLNDYYDVSLKKARLELLKKSDNFKFFHIDITNRQNLFNLLENEKFDNIIHLAAQAGVRYSIENPIAYIDSNLLGFINILEACRKFPVKHLIYASSSSVYGANVKQPFSESDNVDHPVSLYAATKKSNELMAHTYSNLYSIPTTGLRFFTVYGPWGRPDMAYYSFTKNIIEGTPIKVYNNGNLERDFTFIDEIIDGINNLIDLPPRPNSDWERENPDPATSFAPYRVLNIGNNKPVKLMDFINILENEIGKKAVKEYLPMQPGDVYSTYADVSLIQKLVGYQPKTTIQVGLKKFVNWYKDFHNIKK